MGTKMLEGREENRKSEETEIRWKRTGGGDGGGQEPAGWELRKTRCCSQSLSTQLTNAIWWMQYNVRSVCVCVN